MVFAFVVLGCGDKRDKVSENAQSFKIKAEACQALCASQGVDDFDPISDQCRCIKPCTKERGD